MSYCPVCYCDLITVPGVHLQCGCQSCNNCFQAWGMAQLDLSQKLEFRCPMPDCMASLTDQEVSSLFSLEVRSALDGHKLQNYLRDATDIRRCPSPGCAYAGTSVKSQRSFNCDLCGTCWTEERQSWQSLGEGFKTWRDDKLSKLWKVFFCMSCPSCSVVIEKDKGCKHMECVKCGFEFCWLCKGPWGTHRESICAGHGIGYDALLCTGLAIAVLWTLHLLMHWLTLSQVLCVFLYWVVVVGSSAVLAKILHEQVILSSLKVVGVLGVWLVGHWLSESTSWVGVLLMVQVGLRQLHTSKAFTS